MTQMKANSGHFDDQQRRQSDSSGRCTSRQSKEQAERLRQPRERWSEQRRGEAELGRRVQAQLRQQTIMTYTDLGNSN